MRQEEALPRINPLRPVSVRRFELEGSATTTGPQLSPRRELVRVEPVDGAAFPHMARPRPQAAFLAHLLAVAHHAPQTLEKRRAEPYKIEDPGWRTGNMMMQKNEDRRSRRVSPPDPRSSIFYPLPSLRFVVTAQAHKP